MNGKPPKFTSPWKTTPSPQFDAKPIYRKEFAPPCLGAALLTKSTALLVVPVVLGALAYKEVQSLKSKVQSRCTTGQASEAGKGVGRLGVVLAACVVVCGWHYARLWANYGSPLIGVWDPRLGSSWWQDDGYRTGAFYLRFGAVLAH